MRTWKKDAHMLLFGAILGVGGLLFAAPAAESALPEQEPQTTTWRGTLDAGGTKLRLEIEISEGAGEISGELRSLDQNNTRSRSRVNR